MNREKIVFWCFVVASVCFFIESILFSVEKNWNAVTCFCFSVSFFCLALSHKGKKEIDKDGGVQTGETKSGKT